MTYVGAAPGTTPVEEGITLPQLVRTPALYAPVVDGGAVVGTGYYISPTGSDSTGTGAIGSPWRTVDHFLGLAVDGDTLNCRNGAYGAIESVIDVPNVTIRRVDSETPVFTVARTTIGLEIDAAGVTINGLTLTGPGADIFGNAFGIYSDGTYDGLTVTNCTITDFDFSGVHVLSSSGGAGVTIDDNTIADCTYAGIIMCAVTGSVQRNDISDIGVQSTGTNDGPYRDAYGIAVSMATGGTPSSDVLVKDNYIDHVPTWHGLDTHGGIRCDFIHNEVHNCARAIFITAQTGGGIELATNCEISYNLCTDPLSAPSIPPATDHNIGITTYETVSCEVHHNTVGSAYSSITADSSSLSTGLSVHDNIRGETLPTLP